jgi:hypothetical protein
MLKSANKDNLIFLPNNQADGESNLHRLYFKNFAAKIFLWRIEELKKQR